MLRKVAPHCLELVPLEEPLPDVVLLQHRDMRTVQQLPPRDGEAVHPLERRQLPVDGRVGRSYFLPRLDVSLDVCRRDLRHAPTPEPRTQADLDTTCHVSQRLPLVDPIVGEKILYGLLEAHPPYPRRHRHPTGDVALAKAKEARGLFLLRAVRAFEVRAAVSRVLDPVGRAALVDAAHHSPLFFSSPSCSARKARMSSTLSSSRVHCSL